MMSDYELYVKEINSVFEIFRKIKSAWDSKDNSEFIEEFISYKDEVIAAAQVIKEKTSENKGEM